MNVSSAKVLGTRHQTAPKKQKSVGCGEAHSHKNCPNKEKRSPKCANCGGPHVANCRGCPAYKDQAFRQHVVLKQASPPPPHITFNFTAEKIVTLVTNLVIQIARPPRTCLKSKFRQNPICLNRSQKQRKKC